MPTVKVKILEEGDEVMSINQDGKTIQIVVRRSGGSVEFRKLIVDEDGAPRLDPTRIIITEGEGSVEVHDSGTDESGKSDDEGFVVGTF